ncbi:MAG: ABC transporter permease [Hyphomicrobiales bacterium]|nr:ABC transporter permease [Hyphomicrobiales bacterium]
MTISDILAQLLSGLAAASGLFMVAAGLSLIFGVTRIINVAHGSLFMLGIYFAYTFASKLGGAIGFWGGIVASAVIVAVIGVVIEVLLLRRIYRSPELFQLLATFAVVLIINDMTLWVWGPEDLLGPRAPGFRGAIDILGSKVPSYDLFLIVTTPVVLAILHLTLQRTRFGRLVRAATQDREMVGALGVNQALLYTAVFALGSLLSGLGGALQVARDSANLQIDLIVISDAFVVVVVGGMGSITGAYLAAVLIAEIKAICIGIGVVDFGFATVNFSKLTLVAEFLVMAGVLIVRPYGLLGRPQGMVRTIAEPDAPLRAASAAQWMLALAVLLALVALPLLTRGAPYALVLAVDVLIAILFATSLHFIAGPGGMHSLGHAAYFGLGAYGAGLLVKWSGAPMSVALALAPLVGGLGAFVFGWFAVRVSGVYLAMLTLAFSQIVWAVVYQWEDITGGSNGMVGIWPPPPFDRAVPYYFLALALSVGCILLLRRVLFAPLGYAMRAGRDSVLRAEAIGIDVKRVHLAGFVIAGMVGAVAGAILAFAKGSISPETMSIGTSIDGLVMVLLGGLQTLAGPIVGASVFTLLRDSVMRETDFWRAILGGIILLLVLVFPAGLVGTMSAIASRLGASWSRRLPVVARPG